MEQIRRHIDLWDFFNDKLWALFLPVCLLSSPAYSADKLDHEEDNRLYRSAYYLGRGDTGIAIADDQEAIYYNPAGLALGQGIYKRTVLVAPQLEISSQSRDVYDRIAVQKDEQIDVLKDQIGEPFHLGITNLSALVFRRAAVGALVSNNANFLVRKDPEYGGLETINASFFANQILTFSLAESFFDQSFLIGGTVKYVNRSEAGFESNIVDADSLKDINSGSLLKTGKGLGFDLGLIYRTGKNQKLTEHSFGLTAENLGDTLFVSDTEGDELTPLKQTINIGYAIGIGTKLSRMRFLMDYRDLTGAVESNTFKKIHLGSEINVAEFIGVTGGLGQGYPSAGFYCDLRFFRIDVGFYTEERGEQVGMYADQRYYIRILAGL